MSEKWIDKDGVAHDPRDMGDAYILRVIAYCEEWQAKRGKSAAQLVERFPAYPAIIGEASVRGILRKPERTAKNVSIVK